MPLIISESLRSSVVSANSTQGIVTILLSSADLAKLDLSNLQLFTSDSLDLSKHQAGETPPLACTQATGAAELAPGDCDSSDKLANGVQEVVFQSPVGTLASKRYVAEDEFSFQTPLIVSPAAELSPGSFPVFKSRAVADAEKASSSRQSLTMGEISPETEGNEVLRINDYTPERQIKGECSDDFTTSLNEQCDLGSRDSGGGRSNGKKAAAPLPLLVVSRPGLELTPEKAEATLREVSEETMIDLKASPAAKFLLQVMPWELAPSPVTALNTPASVPFLWEDVPGKPKPQAIPSPVPSLRLPPRLTLAPPPTFNATKAAVNTRSRSKSSSPSEHGHHRKNTHSWHVLQNLFTGHSRHSSHEEVTNSDDRLPSRDLPNFSESLTHKAASLSTSHSGESSSFDLSSSADAVTTVPSSNIDAHEANLSNQLPSPYVATNVHLSSPNRNLSPADDDHLRRRRKRSVAGSSINFFANIIRRRKDTKLATNEGYRSPDHWEKVAGSTFPSPSNTYRTLRSGKRRKRRKGRTARVFCRLRRKGSRLLVEIYKTVKCVLLVRRPDHTKFVNDTQLQYQMLQ